MKIGKSFTLNLWHVRPAKNLRLPAIGEFELTADPQTLEIKHSASARYKK
jgi:hypothetical protein